jgi:hypothetical protein
MFAAMLPLMLAQQSTTIWYVLPLAAAISLVYSASRYELTERIVRRASRLFCLIVGFMGAVLIVLWGFSATI